MWNMPDVLSKLHLQRFTARKAELGNNPIECLRSMVVAQPHENPFARLACDFDNVKVQAI